MTARKQAPSKGRLTDKQRRFVEEYLVDMNATQAAIRAGYSVRSAYSLGQRQLGKPEVQAALAAAQQDLSRRTGITQEMVLAELAKIGFSDIRKVVRWGNTELRTEVNDEGETETHAYHGLHLVGADDVDEQTAAAIAEISETREGLKVKLHDKKGALVDKTKN